MRGERTILVISKEQLRHIENSLVEAVARASMRIAEASRTDLASGFSDDAAQKIVRRCFEYNVSQSSNIARILQAYAEGAVYALDDVTAAPLRRKGFSEDERVAAYLRGLGPGRRRVTVGDLSKMEVAHSDDR